MPELRYSINQLPKTGDANLSIMSIDEVKKARKFHESFPQYQMTPLINLQMMANYLGVARLKIKDESYRFGLNAFKVLGGSYAMAHYIADELGKDVSELPYSVLTSEKLLKEFGQATFFSATDGNHGRGVAWAANQLHQKAVILMPKGSTKARYENIKKEGGEVSIEDVNYDDCVRKAASLADKTPHGVIVQDTAWKGYEKIPAWIMQGYGTMSDEAEEQYGEKPTHIFIQAGVGSLAGSVAGYYANRFPENPPLIIVVEADAAACLYRGAVECSGKPAKVTGDLVTIMAGLACGEPNITSWDILKNHAACFIAAKDSVAVRGMRMLGASFRHDLPITSGESGAVGFGAFATIMLQDEYAILREKLGINKSSRVLCFSTEGDTDPERYKNIEWEGLPK